MATGSSAPGLDRPSWLDAKRGMTAVWLAGVFALSGCSVREPTQIMLVVESDLAPYESDEVIIRVLNLRGTTDETNFPLRYGGSPARPGEITVLDGHYYTYAYSPLTFAIGPRLFPLEIGVAPRAADASRVAFFEAIALKDGQVVTRTAARTSFVGSHTVRLVLWLTARCIGVECGPDETCRDGVCRPLRLPPECLLANDFDAGGPLVSPCDEGPAPDGGRDDGGPLPDAGDAGSIDPVGECYPGATGLDFDECGTCMARQRSRQCDSAGWWGGWSDYSACEDVGDCSPGDEQCRDDFRCVPGCGTARCCRTCTEQCRWGTWTCGSCVARPSCVDFWSKEVCEGASGFRTCPTQPACRQECACGTGAAWTDCRARCDCD